MKSVFGFSMELLEFRMRKAYSSNAIFDKDPICLEHLEGSSFDFI